MHIQICNYTNIQAPALQDHAFQFLEGRELGDPNHFESTSLQRCVHLFRGTLEPLEQAELRQPDDQAGPTTNDNDESRRCCFRQV